MRANRHVAAPIVKQVSYSPSQTPAGGWPCRTHGVVANETRMCSVTCSSASIPQRRLGADTPDLDAIVNATQWPATHGSKGRDMKRVGRILPVLETGPRGANPSDGANGASLRMGGLRRPGVARGAHLRGRDGGSRMERPAAT